MGCNFHWDQVSFDPVTNDALFYIHFKPKGMKKQERVFKYDWRMWSIPELKDILTDCGFKRSMSIGKALIKKGGGDGNFTRTEKN